MADDNRPEPIKRAEETTGRITTALGALIAGAAAIGILTPVEASLGSGILDQATGTVPLIAGALTALFTAATSLVSMVATRLRAQPQVTPIVDPIDDRGVQLVRDVDGLRPVVNDSAT